MSKVLYVRSGYVRSAVVTALAALLVFATVSFAPALSSTARAQEAPESGSCAAKILLILDSSGSMTENGNEGLNAVRDAVVALVDQLGKPVADGGAPDSGIAAVHFARNAVIEFATYQNVVTQSATIKEYVTTGAYRTYTHQWTNWEDAFTKANQISVTPDFVFFLTDGQPTTYNGGPTGNNATQWEEGTVRAEDDATTLRNAVPGNNTVIGYGVGAGFVGVPGALSRLERVTDVAVVLPFDELADEIAVEINRICRPSIAVTKSVTPESLPEPGGTVTFTAVVENTSSLSGADVRLTDFSDDVYDAFPGAAECKLDGVGEPVDPGATWIPYGSEMVCTWQASLTEKDAGWSETDTVTAVAVDPSGRSTPPTEDSATVTITGVPPTVSVVKTANPAVIDEPGGNVDFTVVITNESNESVTITSISDDIYGDLAGDADCQVGTVLPIGGECEFTFTGSVTGNAGDTHTNIVTVTVVDNDQESAEASNDATVTLRDVEPTIAVVKTATPTFVYEPGGDVTFAVEVTNDSPEPVTITSLVDDIYGTLDGDADCTIGTILEPGATCDFTFVGNVSGVADDTHTNTVTATATDDDENTAEDSDDAVVLIVDSPIAIDKTVGPLGTPLGSPAFVDVYSRGATETSVTWQITLTNLTDTPLFDLDLVDAGSPSCVTAFEAAVTATESGNTMAPNEVLSFTCDLAVGSAPFINTAEAGGFDQYGRSIPRVSDTATTTIVAASATIGDTVWADENANGIQDNGEKGIANATVQLTLPGGGTVTTVTNSNGLYLFSALPAGTYTATLVMSSIPSPSDGSNKLTTPGSFTITLAEGQSVLTADFGVTNALPTTGMNSDLIALIGLALALAGAAALLATRRRKTDGGDSSTV